MCIMNQIQQVSSAPDYIMKFIHTNMEQLDKIYQEGISVYNIGILDSINRYDFAIKI